MDAHDPWWLRSTLNAKAARRLTTMEPKLCVPAASRTYYALFQACIAHFEAAGKQASDFGSNEQRWRHTPVMNNLNAVPRLCALGKHLKSLFIKLRSRRENADYGPELPEDDDVIADLHELERLLPQLK